MTRQEFDGVVWAMIRLFALVGFSLLALLWVGILIYWKVRGS